MQGYVFCVEIDTLLEMQGNPLVNHINQYFYHFKALIQHISSPVYIHTLWEYGSVYKNIDMSWGCFIYGSEYSRSQWTDTVGRLPDCSRSLLEAEKLCVSVSMTTSVCWCEVTVYGCITWICVCVHDGAAVILFARACDMIDTRCRRRDTKINELWSWSLGRLWSLASC